jgi:CubicO group peptidase (beta-lactamase class C family)
VSAERPTIAGMDGLSKIRFERVHDVLAGHVQDRLLPGAVTLVRRRDEVHVDTVGTTALEGAEPMRRDTIFRIASLTKPVVAVAAMILVEECRVRLDEPVDRLLPELADRQVVRSLDAPLTDTVPAQRAITVRDLLTFRLGSGISFGDPQRSPIVKAFGRVAGFSPETSELGPDEWIAALGELPLMFQPGERWMYNTGSDILGVLIERASGQSLEAFLRERIFAPLGMRDTGFSVPAEQLHRVATAYSTDEGAGPLVRPEGPEKLRTTAARPSASGGLVSTVDDFFAFAELLRHGGRHGSERLLSRPSVEAMTTDQLPEAVKAVSGFLPGWFDSRGWGLGLGISTRKDGLESTPGRYGWDGGSGTSWYTDPTEDLTAILLTQRGAFPQFSPVYLDFWTSVYQSIND